MKRVAALFLALLTCATVSAETMPALDIPSGIYVNDPTHTSLHWRIKHMGLSYYTARMNDVSITVDLDTKDVTRSKVSAQIAAGSVDTGYPGTDKSFDDEIANDPRFLRAGKHPQVTFEATRITKIGTNQAIVYGDLTLRGITVPVSLTATLVGTLQSHPFLEKPAVGFSARGTLDRTAFGIDFLSGQGLADQVEIIIQAELIQQ